MPQGAWQQQEQGRQVEEAPQQGEQRGGQQGGQQGVQRDPRDDPQPDAQLGLQQDLRWVLDDCWQCSSFGILSHS